MPPSATTPPLSTAAERRQRRDSGDETERKKASEAHTAYGEHIKSIVYGGLDGIITTFATVTSVAGAQLSPVVIVVLGISHLVADGLSMGTGDAMSSQAEIDMNKNERRRERWEMENNMQGEVDEMIDAVREEGHQPAGRGDHPAHHEPLPAPVPRPHDGGGARPAAARRRQPLAQSRPASSPCAASCCSAPYLCCPTS